MTQLALFIPAKLEFVSPILPTIFFAMCENVPKESKLSTAQYVYTGYMFQILSLVSSKSELGKIKNMSKASKMSTHCDGRGGRTNQMHRFHPAQFCRIYRIARTLNSDPDRCPGASIRRPSAELLSSMPGRLSLKRSKLQLMGMQSEICMTRIRMGWVRVDIVRGPSIRWPSGCPVDCSSASTGVWLSVSHCAEQIKFFTVALWFDFECKPDGCGLVTTLPATLRQFLFTSGNPFCNTSSSYTAFWGPIAAAIPSSCIRLN